MKVEFDARIESTSKGIAEDNSRIKLEVLCEGDDLDGILNGGHADKRYHITMKEVEEPKPCPFCGGDVVVNRMFITCQECGLEIYGQTEHEVIQKWNRRV